MEPEGGIVQRSWWRVQGRGRATGVAEEREKKKEKGQYWHERKTGKGGGHTGQHVVLHTGRELWGLPERGVARLVRG